MIGDEIETLLGRFGGALRIEQAKQDVIAKARIWFHSPDADMVSVDRLSTAVETLELLEKAQHAQ